MRLGYILPSKIHVLWWVRFCKSSELRSIILSPIDTKKKKFYINRIIYVDNFNFS